LNLRSIAGTILQITLIFFTCVLNAQNESEVYISQEYFQKNQVHEISFFVPVCEKWIQAHPAFSKQMNIKQYVLHYDNKGNCTDVSWSLCSWDSIQNRVDTTLRSLENYLYFKYIDHKLTRIDAISFSEINFIEFNYLDNSIVRHISYVENSQLKTKNDTVPIKVIEKEILNPYDWAVYPTYQVISMDDNLASEMLMNRISLFYFDERLQSKKILIELFHGLLLRIE